MEGRLWALTIFAKRRGGKLIVGVECWFEAKVVGCLSRCDPVILTSSGESEVADAASIFVFIQTVGQVMQVQVIASVKGIWQNFRYWESFSKSLRS